MDPLFKTYKSLIDAYLLKFLDGKKAALAAVNPYGPDMIERVKKMVVAGKTIRGSLVLLSFCFTNEKPTENAIKAAAAMELMQTALVIHDDIMDHDDMRRGIPAMHKQYESESLAMCVGDIVFFLTFELLGSIQTDEVTMGRMIRLVGREYEYVGVAQMGDVSAKKRTKPETLALYTYKTARYTFALPLMLGATLAGPPAGEAGTTKEMLRYLESYGVAVGVLFQIQDDVLDHEKNVFTKEDIAGFKTSASESITRLPITDTHKKILTGLMNFVLTRTN